MKLVVLIGLLVLWGTNNVQAQAEDTLGIKAVNEQPSASAQQEQQSAASQVQETSGSVVVGANILSGFSDEVGASGIKNITDAEQVFCYEAANKPSGYQGYTIDNVALNGFCGVINKELAAMIVTQLLETPSNVSFDTSENCTMNPKLVLRFVRGVDYTDILVSAPCHSIAIFYGGKVKAFNMRAGSELVDTIVDAFSRKRVDFVSPALINQMLPIGIAQNAEQQKLIDDQKSVQPVRNWDKAAEQGSSSTGAEQPKKGGWNNLSL